MCKCANPVYRITYSYNIITIIIIINLIIFIIIHVHIKWAGGSDPIVREKKQWMERASAQLTVREYMRDSERTKERTREVEAKERKNRMQ